MSKLFDIVNEVINSNDLNEAEQKLFGVEEININSEEYFNNIVSNFIKKKEHIIRRENKNLIFDLNNFNDIWSIVFLGEYIKENNILYKEYNELLTEIEKLEKEINNTIKEHRKVNNNQEKALIDQEHKLINQKVNILENKLNTYYDQMKNYKSLIDTFNNIDWVKLENTNDEIKKLEAVKTLKQAINIIHKLRNSIQHGKSTTDNNIEISDEIFKISIPIEYLDGFNKERIIAQEKDKVIVERTNLIASPLLESLGYDVKNVESFFYNVDPEYLSFLLEQVDYNYDELYKLSTFIYINESAVKEFLKNGLDLNYINKLPFGAFQNIDFTLELFKKEINITNWPSIAFKDASSTIELYKMGLEICKLPDIAFKYPEKMKLLLIEGIDILKLSEEALEHSFDLIKLRDNGFNIYELSDDVFNHSESAIWLHNNGLDINNLPHIAFLYPVATKKLLNLGININKLPISAFQNYNSTIQLYLYDLDIYKLPNMAFDFPDSTISLYKKGINICKLTDQAFKHPEAVKKLFEKGINIYKLGNNAFKNTEVLLKLYEEGINIYEISEAAFIHPELIINLYEKDIDISKLPSRIFLLKPDSSNNNDIDNTEVFQTILTLLEKGINIYKMPPIAFECSKVTINYYEKGLDLSKISEIAFYYPEKVATFIDNNIDIYKLPERCYEKTVKVKNIKYLLSLVENNYDRINEFPIEFFTCDISLIEEMYKTYNLNVARSIFGINNPKLIATLVYCDSVLKRYQKENNDRDIVDFAPMNFIKIGYENTLKYKNNISDKEMSSQTYLDQFMIDYDGNYRKQINVKSNILDKLRNSICHFRFKPVKDSNGKIVEDKIYLYDKFENSDNTNFNMIIDIKDLVAIVRTIEMGLEIKNNEVEDEKNVDNSVHRKI